MLVRITIGLLFAISVSAGALAAPCAGFVDVDDSNATYCSAVTYVKNKGITLGCTDASHYCPSDTVNRLQMALFLQRAGKGNADNTLVDSTATIGGGGASGTQLGLPTGNYQCSYPSGGPCANRVTDVFGTIAGGVGNQSGDASGAIDSAAFATVGGGLANTAGGFASTVAGGTYNTASGLESTVAGGEFNTASGVGSTVAGGYFNTASGAYSFAAGHNAQASEQGCFVWADDSITDPIGCFADTFVVRAFGGVAMATGGSNPNYTGARLAAGSGSWSSFSDRNGKDNVQAADAAEVLVKVVSLPVATWNWKSQPATIRHIGPMAQDFHAAFLVGEDDTHISTVDIEGVALAAIQGLYAELKERDATIAEQQREIAELRERMYQVESLRGEVAALRDAIAAAVRGATVAARTD